MKQNSLLLIFIFFYISSYAFETNYVWNIYGIEIKKEPTLNSDTIKKIDFGERIDFEVINELEFTNLKVDNFFEFSGNWLYISFEGNQGYIFNGFLSSSIPSINDSNTIDEIIILGKKIKESVALDSIKFDSNYYMKKTEITEYENGETRYLAFDSCFYSTITFFGLAKNEVQNIILSMFYRSDAIMEYKLTKVDNSWEFFTYSCS